MPNVNIGIYKEYFHPAKCPITASAKIMGAANIIYPTVLSLIFNPPT